MVTLAWAHNGRKREYLRKCNGGGGGISKYMLSMCYLCSLIPAAVVNQESTVGQNKGYCQNEGMSVNYLFTGKFRKFWN